MKESDINEVVRISRRKQELLTLLHATADTYIITTPGSSFPPVAFAARSIWNFICGQLEVVDSQLEAFGVTNINKAWDRYREKDT